MYLLDANTFLEASRLYYAFDLAPGFWEWLGSPGLNGRVGSVEAIRHEIAAGSGELAAWADARPDAFWLESTNDVVSAMRELAVWAVDPDRQYPPEAVDEFLDSTDFKLVAQAMALEAKVVTREQFAPGTRRRITIPDACDAFDVAWTDPFTAYRALGMRLSA